MAVVKLTIGGRTFDVACQDGEEPSLEAAARMLDREAQAFASQSGRMTETQMLLMSGLMLADRASTEGGAAPVSAPDVTGLRAATERAEALAEAIEARLES